MLLPLYREILGHARYIPGANAGLWYDKFCNQWNITKSRSDQGATLGSGYCALDGQSKQEWMKTVIARGPVGDESQLKEVADRMRTLTEARGGLALELSTEWRFVTGLGRSHPVENGFAWHHTLGTPYLPGSSIKGLVKAWVKSLSDRTNEEVEATWFGGPGQVGRVCFLDALPIKPVRLEVDVMTPHYAGWNPSNPPGDWVSPTPIPFLVVAPGACFLFCMIPQDSSLGAESLRAIRGHLTDALTWFGAGAKTAVGYGRFSEDVSAPAVPGKSQTPSTVQPSAKFTSGDQVLAKLLEKKTRKGGWKAQETSSGRTGHIENSTAVPSDKKPGDIVQLKIKSDNADGTLTFLWPTD